jgi:von Willebrand factor type A domain
MLKRPEEDDQDDNLPSADDGLDVALESDNSEQEDHSKSELSSNHIASEGDDGEFEDEVESGPIWLNTDSQAFIVSMMFHVVLILALAIVPFVSNSSRDHLVISSYPSAEMFEDISVVEDVAMSDDMAAKVGANSTSFSDSGMALSTAPILGDVSQVAVPTLAVPGPSPNFELNNQLQQAVGLVRNETVVKGMTGVGTTGTDGAVDRITYELLRSMEERPTLVVWFFDQSGSLQRRRKEIRDRFDRIYEELGIIESARNSDTEKKTHPDEPLLTSVFAFGQQVNLLTKKPTADINEIRKAIDSIDVDQSGVEKVFSSIFLAVDKYKSYRTGREARNVIFVAVTDERGNDIEGLDKTIHECRKYAIPVYVIGVPAPFGREITYVKYVDPDPKFDQSPQWAEVDQGPESLMPERVKLGYKDNYYEEPVVDSGFGPYALSRLAYETGGIYFTVHPNRQYERRVSRREIDPFASNIEYFFDPEIMIKYRPDYESMDEYGKRVKSSPVRQALIRAAQMARVGSLDRPIFRFVRRDEAALINALTEAQQAAARLEPQLGALAQVLQSAEEHRDKEAAPRWIAGYDLAFGTVLAHKVRAEGYNLMLAKAKRGMKFEDEKNNTWVLRPDPEISVGSKLEKEGKVAFELLKEVSERHRGTPWGLLASRELQNPIGWKWVEEYTDLNPPRPAGAGNNNNNLPTPAQNDKAKMLAPPPPKRPLPKL